MEPKRNPVSPIDIKRKIWKITGKYLHVIRTGNGLKDIKAARQAAGEAAVIEPSLDALRNLRRSWEQGGKG